MSLPVWLEDEAVVIFHEEALLKHGGPSGVRDAVMLGSGLARPRNAYAYGEQDLCQLAALYAAGVVKNHPYVDGNKRTGFLCAAVFLELNGMRFVAAEEEVVTMTVGLAAGDVDERAYAGWLRANAVAA